MVFRGASRFGLFAVGVRGRLAVLLAGAVVLVGAFAWAAPARAATGSWLRAWGKGVNGGSAFGICTVAAHCHAGSKGGRGGAMSLAHVVASAEAGDVVVADANNRRLEKVD